MKMAIHIQTGSVFSGLLFAGLLGGALGTYLRIQALIEEQSENEKKRKELLKKLEELYEKLNGFTP